MYISHSLRARDVHCQMLPYMFIPLFTSVCFLCIARQPCLPLPSRPIHVYNVLEETRSVTLICRKRNGVISYQCCLLRDRYVCKEHRRNKSYMVWMFKRSVKRLNAYTLSFVHYNSPKCTRKYVFLRPSDAVKRDPSSNPGVEQRISWIVHLSLFVGMTIRGHNVHGSIYPSVHVIARSYDNTSHLAVRRMPRGFSIHRLKSERGGWEDCC